MKVAEAVTTGDSAAVTRALRAGLLRNVDSIPAELKELRAWLVWRAQRDPKKPGKTQKIPSYPVSGRNRSGIQGSAADLAGLGTWAEAWQRFLADESVAGVGFATLMQFGVVAVDVDRCISGEALPPDIEDLFVDSYAEISPSGTGLRAFYLGEARDGKNHAAGFELFHSKGFVTVTGHAWFVEDCSLATLTPGKRAELERRATPNGGSGGTEIACAPLALGRSAPLSLAMDALRSPPPRLDDLRSALACIPSDDRELWVANAHRLKSLGQFGMVEYGWNLWCEWSRRSAKFDPSDARRVWDSANGDRTSYEALYAEAIRLGWRGPTFDAGAAYGPPGADPIALDWAALPDEPPELEWLIPSWLPAGVVTLFSAHGGSGKSYLSVYVAICLAIGRDPFRERESVARRRVVVYSAEDSRTVMEGRIIHYLRMLRACRDDLNGWLLVLDATASNNVLFAGDHKLGGRATDRFGWLKQTVDDFSGELLIFDNASDAFDANESDRAKVRQFMTMLPRVAKTVLLLAHVDAVSSMADASEAKGYSGSTAWHNSARSRWFMARDKDTGDVVLRQPKVNYAAAGSEVVIRWSPEYRVFAVVSVHEGTPQVIDYRPALLGLLGSVIEGGETVSPSSNSPNSVYNRIRHLSGFPSRLKSGDVSREVTAWKTAGLVAVGQRKRQNRTTADCLALTDAGRALALDPSTLCKSPGATAFNTRVAGG